MSFHRFHAFYEIIKKSKIIKNYKKTKILDYGCYQGAFLYSCKKIFNFKTFGTDFSKEGLKLAKSVFMVDEVFETNNNFFKKKTKVDIISLLHVFEQLSDTVNFLVKIKKNILKKKGFLYLEIRGLYKRGILLRNNKNLNLHVLAKSINEKKPNFNKIMIGKKVYLELLNKRKIIGLKIFLQQLKFLFSSIIRTTYSFIFLILNYFFSNFAVKLHNFIKKVIK